MIPIFLLVGTLALVATGCRATSAHEGHGLEESLPSGPDPQTNLRGNYTLAFNSPRELDLYRQMRACTLSNASLDRGLWAHAFNSPTQHGVTGEIQGRDDQNIQADEVYVALWQGGAEVADCEGLEHLRQEIYGDPAGRLRWGQALMLSPDRRKAAWETADRFFQSLQTGHEISPYLQQKRGDIRALRGEYEEAARFYRAAIVRGDSLENYSTLMRLAQIYRLQGREVRARGYESRAWELAQRY